MNHVPEARAKRKLTHGNAEQANNQLDGRDDVEQRGGLGVGRNKPVEGAQRQAEREEVLEDDHAGEALDGEVACSLSASPIPSRG